MFLLRQALCKRAEASCVSEVWIDVDARVGVEGEFGCSVDAPAGTGDEEHGVRGLEGGCRVGEAAVESEGCVCGVVKDAEGYEVGGCAVSIQICDMLALLGIDERQLESM